MYHCRWSACRLFHQKSISVSIWYSVGKDVFCNEQAEQSLYFMLLFTHGFPASFCCVYPKIRIKMRRRIPVSRPVNIKSDIVIQYRFGCFLPLGSQDLIGIGLMLIVCHDLTPGDFGSEKHPDCPNLWPFSKSLMRARNAVSPMTGPILEILILKSTGTNETNAFLCHHRSPVSAISYRKHKYMNPISGWS